MNEIISAGEEPIPLTVMARETPNRDGGYGINVSTAWRWAMRGCKGIRLETVMIGGQRMTSREARDRFFQRLTAAANGESAPIPTDKQRERAVAAANAELDRAGI